MSEITSISFSESRRESQRFFSKRSQSVRNRLRTKSQQIANLLSSQSRNSSISIERVAFFLTMTQFIRENTFDETQNMQNQMLVYELKIKTLKVRKLKAKIEKTKLKI